MALARHCVSVLITSRWTAIGFATLVNSVSLSLWKQNFITVLLRKQNNITVLLWGQNRLVYDAAALLAAAQTNRTLFRCR